MTAGDAVRAAMARARALTAGTRAASRNTGMLKLVQVREAQRARCLLCSDEIEVGWCDCGIRCTSRRCKVEPAWTEPDEATIP